MRRLRLIVHSGSTVSCESRDSQLTVLPLLGDTQMNVFGNRGEGTSC